METQMVRNLFKDIEFIMNSNNNAINNANYANNNNTIANSNDLNLQYNSSNDHLSSKITVKKGNRNIEYIKNTYKKFRNSDQNLINLSNKLNSKNNYDYKFLETRKKSSKAIMISTK